MNLPLICVVIYLFISIIISIYSINILYKKYGYIKGSDIMTAIVTVPIGPLWVLCLIFIEALDWFAQKKFFKK